jgi:hypothetical protein
MSATAARARLAPPNATPNTTAPASSNGNESAAIASPQTPPAVASRREATTSPGLRPNRSIARPNAKAPAAAATKYDAFTTPTEPSWPVISAAATLPTMSRTGKVIADRPWENARRMVLRRTRRSRSPVGTPKAGRSSVGTATVS